MMMTMMTMRMDRLPTKTSRPARTAAQPAPNASAPATFPASLLRTSATTHPPKHAARSAQHRVVSPAQHSSLAP
ncbi:hypothetical protein EMCG_03888 [[Emmonsia] crescens]|uniref:Uncharacterized protein n=1 Tax=[Emmonsia] crescens TaxID=73230 RepID=A0A0G2HTQ8_9EURO|nr:hypothetical protein EMCG_03888 [Emmonsia crescens UAMH 3008]